MISCYYYICSLLIQNLELFIILSQFLNKRIMNFNTFKPRTITTISLSINLTQYFLNNIIEGVDNY